MKQDRLPSIWSMSLAATVVATGLILGSLTGSLLNSKSRTGGIRLFHRLSESSATAPFVSVVIAAGNLCIRQGQAAGCNGKLPTDSALRLELDAISTLEIAAKRFGLSPQTEVNRAWVTYRQFLKAAPSQREELRQQYETLLRKAGWSDVSPRTLSGLEELIDDCSAEDREAKK